MKSDVKNCNRYPVVKIDIKERPATDKKEYEYKKSVEGWLLKSSYDKSVDPLLRLLMLNSNLMMSYNEVDIKTKTWNNEIQRASL